MRTFLLALIIACCLVFQTQAIFAQNLWAQNRLAQNQMPIKPSTTDSRIVDNNQVHIIYLPTGAARGQLLLFLDGTGGAPRARFPFLDTAASLGYHVINLSYPNSVAAQQACINSPDPDAYIKFRLEIIQGGNIFNPVHVDQANSIENRLRQLLRYLAINQAQYGWGRYLDNNGEPNWQNICVAGQSQGGGHAYVISKFHTVARVIMTGSPKDYSHHFHAPAKGFDTNTKTPLDRYFAFNHTSDTIGACTNADQMQILQNMGLTQFGIANADLPTPNYSHARVILLTAPPPYLTSPKQFHGAPLNINIPSCRPVWIYMLTEPVQ